MPSIDVVGEAFIVADQAELAELLARPALWRAWWPSLELTVFMDRGLKGTRWSVTGELRGSMELWLEPWHDGVIVHWYLRADPVREGADPRRLRRDYVLAHKRHVNALKDHVEAGRSPGEARATPGR
ncbi:MAG TPA: polyketide cyclase / dehydrase and lipid transport [Jiangellales bacterium]|jgi:hypothetical protein|nr:polyketide cyclase / dehydrase and lipid transport [Jiangellales bacterium]